MERDAQSEQLRWNQLQNLRLGLTPGSDEARSRSRTEGRILLCHASQKLFFTSISIPGSS